MQPRILLMAACLQAAALAALAGQAAPQVAVGEAAQHEGHGDIRVQALVTNVRPGPEWTRFTLAGDGERLEAMVQGRATWPEGTWAEARGRIVRIAGLATLMADHVQAGLVPEPHTPGWSDLAFDPASWQDRPIRIQGTIAGGRLGDGDGHRITLGGDWPKAGPVEAIAVLSYAPACLCHRLTAIAVEPWTP